MEKKEAATVKITAVQNTSNVLISIEDDGRGLNRDKILSKAKQNRLIPDDQSLTDEEIYQLIFLPGFSTAEKVSDVSGRGVGMDVVKRAVEKLRGKIKIESKAGVGSKFTIELPTSLSIVDAIIVSQNNNRYAIPVHDLEEIIDINEYDTDWKSNDSGITKIRGKILPFCRISRFIGGQSGRENVGPAIIVNFQDKHLIFCLDHIIGQQQIVVRPLDPRMRKVPGFSGSSIFSNGEPGLILDSQQLAKQFFGIKDEEIAA